MYCTIDQLRANLDKVKLGPEADALLTEKLEAAQSIVDLALGFTFGPYAASAGLSVVGYGSPILLVPEHLPGSITQVLLGAEPLGYWQELSSGHLQALAGTWGNAVYTVVAQYGRGPAPAAARQLVLEIAVNLWREKDKGAFSDVIGVEGSSGIAVGYAGALTNRQKMIIELLKRGSAKRPIVV